MKIRDATSSRKPETNSINTSASGSSSSSQTRFSTQMHQHEKIVDNYEREVDALRTEIESIGDKLEKEPSITNFKQFRDILSRLVTRISTEAYRLEKCGGTPQNPRYFEIITTINAEADKLYNLIVKEQKNNMSIAAKVIGIKGLVVDLIT